MASKRKLNKQCVYCGRWGKVTDDHIPPESLFPGVPNDKLIFVPACRDCNNQASTDDQYFGVIMSLRDELVDHPSMQAISEKVMRGLHSRHGVKLRNEILRTIRPVQPISQSGLFLPQRYAYSVDYARVENFIRRVTKGLFYKTMGSRLPDDYEVRVLIPWAMKERTAKEISLWNEFIYKPMVKVPAMVIGNDEFRFKYLYGTEDPNQTVWLFLFFGKVTFVSLTMSKADVEPDAQSGSY